MKGEVVNVGLMVDRTPGSTDLFIVNPEHKLRALGCSETTIDHIEKQLAELEELSPEELHSVARFGENLKCHRTRFVCAGRYELWVRDMLAELCGSTE